MVKRINYLELTLFSWALNEPSNYGGTDVKLVEGCVVFTDKGFDDFPCSYKLAYICEINIS
jgi:hypothetical protein